MKVIDSSGWIEFVTDGPSAALFEKHMEKLQDVLTPSIVLYEVYKRLKRDSSEDAADKVAAMITKTRIIPLDESLALFAADVSLQHDLAMADAVVYATALLHKATLVTGDADFKGLPQVTYYAKKP